MSVRYKRQRMRDWLWATFGSVNPHILEDVEERGLRFGEESLELIQSLGITRDQALALVEQVYAKPPGDPFQEMGGTTVTLASLAVVANINQQGAFNVEMARVEDPVMMEKIRQKHATKAVVSAASR